MLREIRQDLIKHVKDHRDHIARNAKALDIYQGNLKPYVSRILSGSLSKQYFDTIKDRIIPINILQRYIDKVSIVYNTPPRRYAEEETYQEFIDFYVRHFGFNEVGFDCDAYSNLFKCYALEPFVDDYGKPSLRALPANSFLVYSTSEVNPEKETVFLKFVKYESDSPDSLLIFAYTNNEFDAFTLSGEDRPQYLIENQGINPAGTIPFLYGQRQKNRLIPIIDSDMLAITEAIPCMITDGVGAQMYQSFSILWGIDVKIDEPRMSPNAFWNMKSDRESDKNPQIGTIKPEADTEQIMNFIKNVFILWLETKGVRVGSVGTMDGANSSSGIAKIIDEMDAHSIIKKSAMMFEKEEKEFWETKMPMIHNYWIMSKQINPKEYPAIVDTNKTKTRITFDKPQPMLSRTEQLNMIEQELRLGLITKEYALKLIHPEYTEEQIKEVLNVGNPNQDQTTEIAE